MPDRTVIKKTLIPIAILWIVYALQAAEFIVTKNYMISTDTGIFSIFTGVMLHGDLMHLIGNTVPLLIALPVIARYYKEDFWDILILGTIIPGAIMYTIGINSVGISGLVFAAVWFIIGAGLGSADRTKFLLSIGFLLFYGYTIKGATELAGPGIGYQAHLAGLAVGAILGITKTRIRNNSKK